MDRRQFLTTAGAVGAVGTAAIVSRQFPRSIEERDELDGLPNSRQATIRLYEHDKLVLECPTGIEEEHIDGKAVFGRGAEIQVTSHRRFSFNRATIELAGLPKEAEMPINGRYTVQPGSKLTLQASHEGLLTLEDKQWIT